MSESIPQVELHRHLDISTRIETVHELAQSQGLIPSSTGLDSFKDKMVLKKPLKNLDEVLSTFELCGRVLDRPEVLERVAFEVVEDCYNEGTRAAELRYSPGFACLGKDFSWDEATEAFQRGLNRALKSYPDMKAGLICIGSRDLGVDCVSKSIEHYLKHLDKFIAFDIAGSERDYPNSLYKDLFRDLREKKKTEPKIRITIHAGEDSGPENVWEAIELLGAERIGHGIQSAKDAKLIDFLRTNEICLEICPTSNWLTQAVPSFKEHPLKYFVENEVPVSINTDDPTIFGCTLPSELARCQSEMGLNLGDIAYVKQCAAKHSFL